MPKNFIYLAVPFLLFACISCAPEPATDPGFENLPPTGSAVAGRQLFEAGTRFVTACTACHAIDGHSEAGPDLYGLMRRVDSRVSGQSTERYLYNSIVLPNAYLVPNYAADVMPKNYGKLLSLQQIRDLITFLQTLN